MKEKFTHRLIAFTLFLILALNLPAIIIGICKFSVEHRPDIRVDAPGLGVNIWDLFDEK